MPLSQLLNLSPGELQSELQLILNAVVEGLCGVDENGNVTFCNDALLRMTGLRGEELIGKNLHGALHYKRADGTAYPDEECPLHDATIARRELHIVADILWRKDGTSFPAEYWAHPVRHASSPTVSVITFQDLTERERAFEALRTSEEKFRKILMSVADVAWTSDRNGRTLYISPKIQTVLGYTKQEISAAGSTLRLGLIHPGDFGRVKRNYLALFDQKTPFDEEYRIRRKDGAWIWIHDHASATHEEAGVPYADGAFRDISARKHGEAELQSKTAFLEALANSTIDGILVVGNGDRLLHNQQFVEMFHVPASVLVAKEDGPLLEYTASLMKDREAFVARIKHLYRHPDETSRDEIELKDGRFLDRYSAGVIDRNGTYHGRIWTFRDITERKQDEQKLRRSQTYLAEAQKLSHIGSWAWQINQRESVHWSEEHYRIFGLEPGNGVVPFQKSLAGIHPDDLPGFIDTVQQSMAEKKDYETDARIVLPDGSTRNIHAIGHPILNESGELIEFLGLSHDVTERKKNEDMLQQLSMAVEQSPASVMITDPEGRISYTNRKFTEVTGYQPKEVLGMTPRILKSGLTPPEAYRNLWSAIKEGREWRGEFCNEKKNGELFWEAATIRPIFDASGTITHYLALKEDITERRRAERELRLTQFSVEQAFDGVLWADRDARIIYVNQAACRNLERSREELLSLSIPDIAPPFSMEDWKAHWQQLKTAGVASLEASQTSKSGRVFPVEVTANYLEFDGQEYSFAFVRDVTERRELEGQLRHAQKLEGIGQLAAGIAHEINTPTQFVTDNLTFLRDSWNSTDKLLRAYRNAIKNSAEALPADLLSQLDTVEKSSDLDFLVSEVPRAIDQSLDGAHRIAEIVRAMKEFSHPDSLEKTATDLNKGVVSTITVARNEWRYIADVATRLDDALPSVVCYPGDVNQVVLNLVVNAAHAIKEKMKDSEKGKITVCTRMRGEFAEISVTDTGNGIPEKIRTRIFDPFFTTKEVGKGTGQGLSLAHAVVVKKHGGKIWFETELGRGTTFFINLPIKPPDRGAES